jgi:hypothetical protein
MRGHLREFSRLNVIRRTQAWAPIVWFPIAIALVAASGFVPAVGVGLAGITFGGMLRAWLRAARCPRCSARFGDSVEGFTALMDESRCASCGLSLFELRRSGPFSP